MTNQLILKHMPTHAYLDSTTVPIIMFRWAASIMGTDKCYWKPLYIIYKLITVLIKNIHNYARHNMSRY